MTVTEKIQSLIAAANDTTGENDATLTDAVQTLIDGFGQGGGGGSGGTLWGRPYISGSFTLAQDVTSAYTVADVADVYVNYRPVVLFWRDSVDGIRTTHDGTLAGSHCVTVIGDDVHQNSTALAFAEDGYNTYQFSQAITFQSGTTNMRINFNTAQKTGFAGTTYHWIAIRYDVPED